MIFTEIFFLSYPIEMIVKATFDMNFILWPRMKLNEIKECDNIWGLVKWSSSSFKFAGFTQNKDILKVLMVRVLNQNFSTV